MIENALCKITLTAYEWRLLMYVLRMTNGWNRSEFETTLGHISTSICIDRPNVCRTLKRLEAKLIISSRKATSYTTITLNPDYMTWRVPGLTNLFSSPDVMAASLAMTPVDEAAEIEAIRAMRAAFHARHGHRGVVSSDNTPESH